MEEAKKSPEPDPKDLWTDIYYKGTEPPFMRGREREEVCVLPNDIEVQSCIDAITTRFTITRFRRICPLSALSPSLLLLSPHRQSRSTLQKYIIFSQAFSLVYSAKRSRRWIHSSI